MTTFAKRILSGVQPTGNLHLGNYLGAIQKFASFQKNHECLYCIVDLHAITVWQDPAQLTNNIRETTAAFLAAGVDPKNHIIFNQSQVGQHAELAWIFNCVARMGWLNRMTQFKEKAGKNRENASVGLFSYPNLMAADILLYKATHVPVGNDQKQHLELTRDIAAKFNGDFSDRIAELNYGDIYFPMIEPLIDGPATRVMSLRNGLKKMSKSDPSDLSRINLTDDANAIIKKIRKAKTDMNLLPADIEGLENRPEADNLVGIYAALDDNNKQSTLDRFGGKSFSEFKLVLAELTVEKLAPIKAGMHEYLDNPDHIDAILANGADRAREIAKTHMKEIHEIFGFVGKR